MVTPRSQHALYTSKYFEYGEREKRSYTADLYSEQLKMYMAFCTLLLFILSASGLHPPPLILLFLFLILATILLFFFLFKLFHRKSQIYITLQ